MTITLLMYNPQFNFVDFEKLARVANNLLQLKCKLLWLMLGELKSGEIIKVLNRRKHYIG